VASVHRPRSTSGLSPRWTADKASVAAAREGGHAKGVRQCDRGTTHRSLDDSEEATRQRRSFGSEGRRR
jgi:hypothetical protein